MLESIVRKKHATNPRLARALCQLLLQLKPSDSATVQLCIDTLGSSEVQKLLTKPKPDIQNRLACFDTASQPIANPRLKIAICMSGETRSFGNTAASILRFFNGHDVRIFAHHWSDDPMQAPIDIDDLTWVSEDRPDFSALERASITAFGMKGYKNGVKIPLFSPNLFPMWYGVKQAFNSIPMPNDFDLIVRCRYDDLLIGHANLLSQLPTSNEVIIDPAYNGYGGYGDQFSIGTPSAMRRYCHLFDWLPQAIEQHAGTERFFPEVVLKTYLEEACDLEVREINLGLRLLRDEFVGMEPHLIPLRSHHFSQQRNAGLSNYIRTKHPDLYENS
ncbi:Uncharacterised protein [BD1-7 clade bacterium]|uniref:Uncharacterized protein n=1 Tax=BD1-7 clade bacterium TaxID=2029982 RepID=A0A5S9QHV9_9GAMM|nr:Uncharacterised protein [BD1-7 clade bacterium]